MSPPNIATSHISHPSLFFVWIGRVNEVSHREFEGSISEEFESFIMRRDALRRFVEKRPMNTGSLIECDIHWYDTESEKYFRNFYEDVGHDAGEKRE
jgi:hypothetical protein